MTHQGYDVLKLCHCHDIESYFFCCRVLSTMKTVNNMKDVMTIIAKEPESASEIIIGYFNMIDVLEHGSSVRASWLTKKGEQLLLHHDDTVFRLCCCHHRDTCHFCYQVLMAMQKVGGLEDVIDIVKTNLYASAEVIITMLNHVDVLNHSCQRGSWLNELGQNIVDAS